MNRKDQSIYGFDEPGQRVFFMLSDVLRGMPAAQVAKKYNVCKDTVYRNRKKYQKWYMYMREKIENAFVAKIVQDKIMNLGQSSDSENK